MSAMTCPGCGAAAEITERFTLASTDGPVAHVALSCAGGHHYRMAADRLPASASRRLRVMLIPARKPHTFPVCIHCLVNPAGFWVSGKDSNVVRRPWCLSCCEDLDREHCDMIPFGA